MKTLQLLLAMLLMSVTVSAQFGDFFKNAKKYARQRERAETIAAEQKQHYDNAIKRLQIDINVLDTCLTENDIQRYIAETERVNQQADSILALMTPYVEKGNNVISISINGPKHEFEQRLNTAALERAVRRLQPIMPSNPIHAKYDSIARAKHDSIKRVYSDKIDLYRRNHSYAKQHSNAINQLIKLKSVKNELDEILTSLETELNKSVEIENMQATGVYKTKWIEPINEADIITATAPYITVNGRKVYNGQCILKRTKKQRSNATGDNYFNTTYNVTITLIVDKGIVKSAKYSGTMSWWGQNDNIRKQYKNLREGTTAMLNARPIIVQTKPITKYEDFGYQGDLAQEMLRQLKTISDTDFDKQGFVYNCLISNASDRPKLIQEFAERYRAYKHSIFIDYSELKK